MARRTPDRPTTGQPRGTGRAVPVAWIAADVALVLAFAASGRRTHEHGVTPAGVLETAWPFLLAYAVAALVSRAWCTPGSLWPTAVALWLVTVAGGLVVRGLTGAGVALSFQVVTLLVLGAFLLAPRAVARAVRARRRRPVA